MKTQLLINYRPQNANVEPPYSIDLDGVVEELKSPPSIENEFNLRLRGNPNINNDLSTNKFVREGNLYSIDLYEDTDIPLNYTIMDIREPDKRKTNFSKTIVLPGTTNNNKIFNHVYEISGSSKFNPNLRTEVIILQDGVQVMRGNMQLKNIIKTNEVLDYEIIITGDFTSLFADIGVSKISDLDMSEWAHIWSAENIQSSWNGQITKNDQPYSNVVLGTAFNFNSYERDETTNRVKITTTLSHNFQVGQWIRIIPNSNGTTIQNRWAELIYGDFLVVDVPLSTEVIINWPFPQGGINNTLPGTIRTITTKGEGYVYPMISWGDDSIQNIDGQEVARFPVTSMVMSFFVKEIWDKIFKMTNSRYQSNFLETDFFKRLILTQKKANYELPSEELESRSFKVANFTQHNVTICGGGSNNSGNLPLGNRKFPVDGDFISGLYPFSANITTSNGLLYNGTLGSRPFDQGTNKWRVTDSGKYSLEFNITLQVEAIASDYRTNGNFEPAPTTPVQPGEGWHFKASTNTGAYVNYENSITATVTMFKLTSGMTQVIDSQSIDMIRKADGTLEAAQRPNNKTFLFPQRDFTLGFEDLFLNKDDEIYVKVSYNHNLRNNEFGVFTYLELEVGRLGGRWLRYNYRGQVNLRNVGVEYLINTPSNSLVENSLLFPNQFLPSNLTCRDFVLGIIRAFNLHIEADKEVEKLYKIEPRDDYYKDGSGGSSDYVNWSDKVDLQSMEITPMGELTAKFYNFNYRADNDYWNKRYRDDVGLGYGDYIKEIQNDFLTNKQDISLPFGAAPMLNSPKNSDIVIPQVVQRDSNGVNKITNVSPKFLIWGGVRPTSKMLRKYWQLAKMLRSEISSTGFEESRIDLTYYPYAGTVDSPGDPFYDLNWYYTEYVYWNRGRWTNSNLYNKYWRTFIEEITDVDSKVIKANLLLKPKDIYDLDFSKIYIIDNNYLRLQRITDYNANAESLTECEFLKLKAPSRFKPVSIGLGQNFGEVRDNSRPVSTITIEQPPVNFKDRFPISNWSSNDLSGVSTVTINGQNNVISSGTNNVSISGDECYIGSGTSNVNISGNAVFVAGGLKNVTVIGTDKIFINESDVTYINGIRYKKGVAISKSSVIDAGLNKVITSASINTTSNVIDACEDLVIRTSSASYEDVIDAGVDRILPDVADYGVSTPTSPNAINNYVNQSILITPIESLPERIIAAVNPAGYQDGNNAPAPLP